VSSISKSSKTVSITYSNNTPKHTRNKSSTIKKLRKGLLQWAVDDQQINLEKSGSFRSISGLKGV
jgi:hypothetical protein